MMAYLTMMAVRLIELHRVLKDTGSLYLHCDPTASHYLKILLDAVFGKGNYGNEIIWQRTNSKSLASTRFAKNHDTILRYTKSNEWIWNPQFTPHDPDYVRKFYKYKDSDGRVYRLGDITNPNKNRPNLTYEFLGVLRVWRWTEARMQKAFEDGIVIQTKPGAVPVMKRYLDEQQGNPVGSIWSDIKPVQPHAQERLGYPTQKPVALLERILMASSNEGDTVLDPFCGCGTTVHAAQKLNRNWIGIDVTHLAIGLIERRLKDAFEGIEFETHGTPKDIGGAAALAAADKYEFEKWALSLINAQPWKGGKKGADKGIDGIRYIGKSDRCIVSVKGGKNVGVAMVRDLVGVLDREGAQMGVFLTLTPPTKPMLTEAAAAGQYAPDGLTSPPVPKVQIVTVEELLEHGERALRIPLAVDNYKKATKEKDNKAQGKLDI